MAGGSKEVVKHVLLVKFKDDVTPHRIEETIKAFANLVAIIEPLKAFHWGRNVSPKNLHQGFTHFIETTFESIEGVAEYIAHPAHVDYSNEFLGSVEKFIGIDYKPTDLVTK